MQKQYVCLFSSTQLDTERELNLCSFSVGLNAGAEKFLVSSVKKEAFRVAEMSHKTQCTS